MTIKEGERLARPRICGAVMSLPDSVTGKHLVQFKCQERHDPTEPKNDGGQFIRHSERGRVKLRNGRIYSYVYDWYEEQPETWREEAQPRKREPLIQHDHAEYVEGCARCELAADEVDGVLKPSRESRHSHGLEIVD